MIDCRFKPIEKWPSKPTPSWSLQRGQFKAGWQKTLDLLERELNRLLAKDITVEGFFRPADIRNDGWPKSSSRPPQPGVILSFSTDEAAERARILIQHASVGYTTSQILGDQQIFKQVYAEAMRRTHPDTSPGRDIADFQNVVNARDRIKTLKGWS